LTKVLSRFFTKAIDGSVQLPGQTVSSSSDEGEKEEEEPHPYTISFFVFPHGAATDLLDRTFNKKKTIKHAKLTTNALKGTCVHLLTPLIVAFHFVQ